jgi:hypothetical protein
MLFTDIKRRGAAKLTQDRKDNFFVGDQMMVEDKKSGLKVYFILEKIDGAMAVIKTQIIKEKLE